MALKDTLDQLVLDFNIPSFTQDDPVQFPRRFSDKRDIEITALLISTIAWGRRPMILKNSEKILDIMQNEPLHFVAEGDIDGIAEDNIHRTFFGRHLRYFLRGLREVYHKYGSLEDFAAHIGASDSNAPSWLIAQKLNQLMADANPQWNATEPTRGLPADCDKSALKRFNMALRWLVRKDGIVDIGCWDLIKPSQLYIPLDVHSANTSRSLGLLTRKQNDRRAVEELTQNLRTMNPEDPTIYDFALFGAGVTGLNV